MSVSLPQMLCSSAVVNAFFFFYSSSRSVSHKYHIAFSSALQMIHDMQDSTEGGKYQLKL